MTTTKDKLRDALADAVAELVAEAVEAAYREGHEDSARRFSDTLYPPSAVDADWKHSDAKRNCD